LNIDPTDEREPDLRPLPKPVDLSPAPTPPESKSANAGNNSPAVVASISKTDTSGLAFHPIEAPAKVQRQHRQFVVTGVSTRRAPKTAVSLVDESETLEIAEQFERDSGRYPIRVSHLRGYKGPRCDILSLETEEAATRVAEAEAIDLNAVVRFIEVKGRSQRTGAVELEGNELDGAQEYGERFFLYRVFCDPASEDHRELAVLQNPCISPAISIKRILTINLHEGSGAEWFEMKRQEPLRNTDESAI
jgi:hypothetical protein